jgi:predicted glycosyltransferase
MNDRLDLLLYAHDGRGLGHASRSVAIGMAARRLYPDLKVLFITGSRMTPQLIGNVPLDWVKLPAYKTKVVDGVSTGRTGYINLTDNELGECRGGFIKNLVDLLRPRCILADHTPQGKHKELVPALESSHGSDTAWVLGVRGWVGSVPQVWSDLSKSLFADFYGHLMWYGDSRLLGDDHLRILEKHFNIRPRETGYVCRISELDRWLPLTQNTDVDLAGVVSIPWLGEASEKVIKTIFRALEEIGPRYGGWHLFVGSPDDWTNQKRIQDLFSELQFCTVTPTGEQYRQSLLNAKTAVIYGGYNSLTDVFYANIPAVVLLREMQDEEQQAHLNRLSSIDRERLITCSEKGINGKELAKNLIKQICSSKLLKPEINLDGAAMAARHLFEIISNPK